jgi:multicomponent Na+:H+ antiporter subunit E
MKYTLTLCITLVPVWFLWSGKTMPFILILGGLSVLLSLWISHRMGVDDEEGSPLALGLRSLPSYLPYLAKEIVVSNIDVAKMILSKDMNLKRNMIEVSADQKTSLGKVVLANSITLTPGTVSVKLEDDRILVHALSFEGAEEDLSGDMSRRVCELEGTQIQEQS